MASVSGDIQIVSISAIQLMNVIVRKNLLQTHFQMLHCSRILFFFLFQNEQYLYATTFPSLLLHEMQMKLQQKQLMY